MDPLTHTQTVEAGVAAVEAVEVEVIAPALEAALALVVAPALEVQAP